MTLKKSIRQQVKFTRRFQQIEQVELDQQPGLTEESTEV